MTTIGMSQDRGLTMARPVGSASMVRQVLLACGILSSLLYVATDVLGGMRYESYSFTSQAISELGAIGAPSKPFVDPFFIAPLKEDDEIHQPDILIRLTPVPVVPPNMLSLAAAQRKRNSAFAMRVLAVPRLSK